MDSTAVVPMPAIVHHSLSKSPIAACLAQQGLKLRVSETSSERSVIFPMSKVAFYYLHMTPALLSSIDTPQQLASLLHSVARFVEVHAQCYIVMVTSDFCEKTFTLLGEFQTQHLNSRLQVLPADSVGEAASAMVNIAKLQCRPLASKMHMRFCLLLNHLLLEDTFPRLLAQLGLDSHQQQLVQDGIGSVSKLASASASDLMDCALDCDTALKLTNFFGLSQN